MHLLALVVMAAAEPSCTDTTEPSRPFATCFDPWRGLSLAGGATFDGARVGLSLSTELRLRRERPSWSKGDSTWLSLHRVGAATWAPTSGRLDATAWEFVMRRHASDTSLTLPSFGPGAGVTRLPFPFDIGLGGAVARFELNTRPTEKWALETGRLALLFDPVRAETNQVHLSFGPLARHRLAEGVDGGLSHELLPLTAGALVVRAETNDGFFFVRGTALGGAALQLDAAARWRPSVQADVEAGLVLLAVNDQPLVLSVKSEAWWRGAALVEWSASASLGLRLFSARG